MASVLIAVWARLPRRVRATLRRILLRTRAARKLVWREKGIGHELEFWERWFATDGYLWKDDFKRRLDADAPLEERLIVERLPELDADPVSILDVGAGPLTFLGKRYPGRSLLITPVDPLADAYDRLLAEFRIEPPVRTVLCPGEKLLDRFPAETFDIENGRFVLWNKATKHDVTEAVRRVADAEAFRDDEGGGDWVVCVLRKRRLRSRSRRRVRPNP